MSSYDFDTTITVGFEEIPVTVEYTVTAWGCGMGGPTSYGPGDPPEPPEFEIISVYDDNKEYKWDDLCETDQNRIDQGIYEHISEMDDGPDDYYD